MNKTLFVAGLDFAIKDDELREVFSNYGSVESAKVILDRYSNRSRGFGFVEMSTHDEAQAATTALDNTMLRGRQIIVKFKEDRTKAN